MIAILNCVLSNIVFILIALKYRQLWKSECIVSKEEHAAAVQARNNEFRAACKIRQLERQVTALSKKR